MIVTPRMCIDYRALNAKTKKDAYPIPRVDDLLDTIEEFPAYFTSLDLFSGYNQIGLTLEAQLRSAFVIKRGHYQFTRMAFGLCNAPATFQRVMNEIFEDYVNKFMTVYIDDIEIYSTTFEEHIA